MKNILTPSFLALVEKFSLPFFLTLVSCHWPPSSAFVPSLTICSLLFFDYYLVKTDFALKSLVFVLLHWRNTHKIKSDCPAYRVLSTNSRKANKQRNIANRHHGCAPPPDQQPRTNTIQLIPPLFTFCMFLSSESPTFEIDLVLKQNV